MSDQLDVFLGEQTAPFLAELFEVISSEVYLQGATQTNAADAEVKMELAQKETSDAETAASASKPTSDKLNRRTSPSRPSDNQTSNDNNTDYVSSISTSCEYYSMLRSGFVASIPLAPVNFPT